MVKRLFLAVPWGCLRFVIVVFPDHTHLLLFIPCFYTLYKYVLNNTDKSHLKYVILYLMHQFPIICVITSVSHLSTTPKCRLLFSMRCLNSFFMFTVEYRGDSLNNWKLRNFAQ